ncbi:hypothetical protein HC776_01670 [bacterium]|nr:hypothetical protein [bacterium]
MLHALRLSSLTGQFGIFSRLERFGEMKMDRMMDLTLSEIRQGTFSREWVKEYAGGYSRLKKLLHQQEQMELWDLENRRLRCCGDFSSDDAS